MVQKQKIKFEKNISDMKSKCVICFGEVLWDMLPTGQKPGGAPLNVAIHLKQQGQIPIIISKIGNDNEGKRLLHYLNNAGLNNEYIEIDPVLPTGKVLVQLDRNKNATYKICEPVAWDNIMIDEPIENRLAEANLIIFGSLASRNLRTRETLFHLLDQLNVKRLCDVNLRPPYDKKEVVEELLKRSDFIKLNEDEMKVFARWNAFDGSEKVIIQQISDYYSCSSVCVTRGKNGAIFYYQNRFYEHPGFFVETIDTIGAGDSFLASLVSALIKNNSPEKALEKACATGALVTSRIGAVPLYSSLDIDEIINSGKK